MEVAFNCKLDFAHQFSVFFILHSYKITDFNHLAEHLVKKWAYRAKNEIV